MTDGPEELDFEDIEQSLAAETEWQELVDLGEAVEYIAPEWYPRLEETAVICDQCAGLVDDNPLIRKAHEDYHREIHRYLAVQEQRLRRLMAITSALLESVKLLKGEMFP